MVANKLLEVQNLKVYFDSDDGVAKAVDEISYTIEPGKTLGLVGESGCGKSVSALAILQLIPNPPGRIPGGKIIFKGQNLLEFSEAKMRKIRGNQISMVFQEPMTALNPILSVERQITEVIVRHQNKTKALARKEAIRLLDEVGISDPEKRLSEYPHQLSGGMKQRVMIAMALACRPALLIADEPTTALDVTVQAQILDLLRKLQKEYGMAILLITHDLGVIAEMADEVVVMYAGKIAEKTDVRTLYKQNLHPYTQGLFRAIPNINLDHQELEVIEGVVPNPLEFPTGCRFSTRCPKVMDHCHHIEPELMKQSENHFVACHAVNLLDEKTIAVALAKKESA